MIIDTNIDNNIVVSVVFGCFDDSDNDNDNW